MATVVNDVHLFSAKRAIDLAPLNETERRVLRLLAEGHTAKTVAAELDMSSAAVNERLREARRKTGVGSSRELARLLKAQENRHKQIGVGRGGTGEADFSRTDAEPWRPRTGVFAMIAVFVMTAGAAALMTQAPASTNEVDPLLSTPLTTSPDPAALHAKIRSERRDNAWAPRMEQEIRARLMSLPLVGKDGNVLRVTCASTLCEIAGTIIAPESRPEREDQNSQFNRTIRDLQVPPLTDDLTRLGLKLEVALFTGGKGKPDRTAFLLYYSRAQAKAK